MNRASRIVVLLSLIVIILSGPGWSYRDYFTPEQKAQLAKIQTVNVEVIALTDKGPVEPAAIEEVVARRMAELGYTIVQEASKPADVVFKIKCEQKKTWEGTTAAGGDADLPDTPSRLWKGPACQLTYLLGGMKIKWQKEVRTDYQDTTEAALNANRAEAGAFVMTKLKEQLEQYDFPLFITAEWGQPDRLLKLLDVAGTDQIRKVRIISLLGDMQADEALPRIKEVLRDRGLAKQAAVALGSLGKEGIPVLVEILNTSQSMELQAAAAKGLGQLGGTHGDSSVVPPLLEKLQKADTDWIVLTEVAWSLGRIPDKRSIQPLYELDKRLQSMREPDNQQLKKLKEAVYWAIKQCDTWDQYS